MLKNCKYCVPAFILAVLGLAGAGLVFLGGNEADDIRFAEATSEPVLVHDIRDSGTSANTQSTVVANFVQTPSEGAGTAADATPVAETIKPTATTKDVDDKKGPLGFLRTHSDRLKTRLIGEFDTLGSKTGNIADGIVDAAAEKLAVVPYVGAWYDFAKSCIP